MDNLLFAAKNLTFDFGCGSGYDEIGKRIVHNVFAVTYLNEHVAKDQHLFLALDDGSSKYSKLGGSCAIGNKYQIVVTNQDDQDYALPLENDAGLKLTTGDPETDYFGSGLTLDFKNASLALRDDSGILDGAVTLNQVTSTPQNDDKRREEMKSLGGKIC